MAVKTLLGVFLASVGLVGCNYFSQSRDGSETAAMTFAPQAPAPISRNQPKHLVVNLSTAEEDRPLADNVTYEFWSYNGHTPGPVIRLRVGDTFEVRLGNSKGKLTHTADFHAVTGPGGDVGRCELSAQSSTKIKNEGVVARNLASRLRRPGGARPSGSSRRGSGSRFRSEGKITAGFFCGPARDSGSRRGIT